MKSSRRWPQKSEIKEGQGIGNRKLKEEFNSSVLFLTEVRTHEIFWKITLIVVNKVD